MLMTIYEFFLHIHIITCIFIFIIEMVYVLLDFTKKKHECKGFLEYVANACGHWFSMKGAHGLQALISSCTCNYSLIKGKHAQFDYLCLYTCVVCG